MTRTFVLRGAAIIVAIALVGTHPAIADSHGEAAHASPAHGEPAHIEPLPVDHGSPDDPPHVLRALQILQARIAAGRAAPSEQAATIRQLAGSLPQQPSDVWKDGRNARILAIFLFNGGDAATVRTVLAKGEIAASEKSLVDGALAYSEGRLDAAKILLAPLDPRALPGDAGGHLALVQATLLAPDDVPGALQRLDLARLLVPGTLIEEAALRRATFLLSEFGPISGLAEAVKRYRLRFGASAYAVNFETRVRATVLDRWPTADIATRALLVDMTWSMPADLRSGLWLTAARRVLVAAKPDLVQEAISHAFSGNGIGAEARKRADFYLAAAALFESGKVPASKRLALLDGQIAAADRDLWRAAKIIADNIEAPMPKPAADIPGAGEGQASPAATILSAQHLLAQALP